MQGTVPSHILGVFLNQKIDFQTIQGLMAAPMFAVTVRRSFVLDRTRRLPHVGTLPPPPPPKLSPRHSSLFRPTRPTHNPPPPPQPQA